MGTKIKLLTAVVIGAMMGTVAATPASAGPLVTAEYFATNSSAAGHPDPSARSIDAMAVHNGEIYSGWGNYDANHGPIPVMSHNIATGAETQHFVLNGEEINTIRTYNGVLYVPDIDPKLGWSANVGYATNDRGAWRYNFGTPAQHIFDVAVLGNEIFVAAGITNPDKAKYGPTNDLAAIKKSVDGGVTWTIEKWRATDPAKGESGYDRYYWLAVAGGKLFASASVNINHAPAILDVYSGGKWTEAEQNIGVNLNYSPDSVQVIGNKVVGINKWGGLWVIDSGVKNLRRAVSTVSPGFGPNDLSVAGNTIYSVSSGNGVDDIYSSQDGINWVHVMTVDIPAPDITYTWHNGTITTTLTAKVTDVTFADGTYYLGTNFGEIWKARP